MGEMLIHEMQREIRHYGQQYRIHREIMIMLYYIENFTPIRINMQNEYTRIWQIISNNKIIAADGWVKFLLKKNFAGYINLLITL